MRILKAASAGIGLILIGAQVHLLLVYVAWGGQGMYGVWGGMTFMVASVFAIWGAVHYVLQRLHHRSVSRRLMHWWTLAVLWATSWFVAMACDGRHHTKQKIELLASIVKQYKADKGRYPSSLQELASGVNVELPRQVIGLFTTDFAYYPRQGSPDKTPIIVMNGFMGGVYELEYEEWHSLD